MKVDQRIKLTVPDFGDFLWLIGIWMFITENPGMNQLNHFRETHIYMFGVLSIRVNQFIDINWLTTRPVE